MRAALPGACPHPMHTTPCAGDGPRASRDSKRCACASFIPHHCPLCRCCLRCFCCFCFHVPAAAATNTINTIQRLTEQEESLDKRKALLEKKIEAEMEKAREFTRQKKKPQALQCLKKKKLLESQIMQLENMVMRVLEQRQMLESQRTTVEVVSTLHASAIAGKENMKAMKIENVDKVLDEINETNDQMKQLNDVFSQPTGLSAELDEDELLGELEELEATELDAQLMEPAAVPTAKVPGIATAAASALPSVPQRQPARPAAAKTQEELELEALEAEMAL